MNETAEKERLKKRLDVYSGGAARLSPEEAKEKLAKHKAVLISKESQGEGVVARLRRLGAKVRHKVSRAVKRRRKKKTLKPKKKKKAAARHRMP
jgi:hypothetical protein